MVREIVEQTTVCRRPRSSMTLMERKSAKKKKKMNNIILCLQMEPTATSPVLDLRVKKYSRADRFSDQEDDDGRSNRF